MGFPGHDAPAEHLVDEVFPQVPVRQWVLSFPKQLRFYLASDANLRGSVLRIFLNSAEKRFKRAALMHRTLLGRER